MSLIDSVVRVFNPAAAVKRERARVALKQIDRIKASGYGSSGGSHHKKSMQGWIASSGSPQQDIDPHLHTLRVRSRDLFMSAPLAASAVRTKRTNIVGPGLQLKPKIDAEFLGLSKEQAAVIEKQIEREWAIWANKRHCDALRQNNFFELQALACMAWFLNGESFGLIKHKEPTKYAPYSLRIHLIEADRISTPNSTQIRLASWMPTMTNTVGTNKQNGNAIYNGVEVSVEGEVVAYWVCNQYPRGSFNGQKKEWVRVKAYGEKTGNPNIIHLMDPERCEQYRGVPFLAPVIESLKQVTRYQEAELMAALVQALYTVFIEVEDDTTEIPFSPAIPDEDRIADDDDTVYELGPGAVNILGKGEKAVFADPKRPASGFADFIENMAKMIGAALEIPQEILLRSFNSSYSASRAALLEMWKAIKTDRARFIADFCQPIYEIWFAEAVARGRIHAPGFFNDPLVRDAWCRAEWIGPTQGLVRPVEEVQAAILRVQEGFSTRAQETMAMTGGNWDDNIARLAVENERLRVTQATLGEGGENDGEISNQN